MKCKECYSENPRIIPLKGTEDYLIHHLNSKEVKKYLEERKQMGIK